MTEAFIETFLSAFDDSRFPDSFLHKYELMECLSYNDLGETFLVKNKITDEYFVAKCYLEKLLIPHLSESEVLKKIRHEGIPVFIDEYRNEHMCCVVRTYIQGTPLDKLAQARSPDRRQSISIVAQLCDLLGFLHKQNPPVIHRDIKPQNIIVDDQGKIALIDFGISRIYNKTSKEDTFYFGTKHYAAPEQYGYAQTDWRSDIYSVGILLSWLLTGKTELNEVRKMLKNDRLAGVINKCTAFDPKNRFRNILQVKNALTGRTLKRQILCLCVLFLLLAGALPHVIKTSHPTVIKFTEPRIEEAVRLALNKNANEPISQEELLSINELYIFGDHVAVNQEQFDDYVSHFATNDGTIKRGDINSLEDLTRFRYLRRISLAYQNITDTTPLAALENLEYVNLQHNPVDDVSPLGNSPVLNTLILFDTKVTDLTALQHCDALNTLDVGYTPIESMAALAGLDALRLLAFRKSSLRSIEHIEMFPMLQTIYLSETQICDLSPLLVLPNLQQVEISESMRAAADSLPAQINFNISYQ